MGAKLITYRKGQTNRHKNSNDQINIQAERQIKEVGNITLLHFFKKRIRHYTSKTIKVKMIR